MDNNHTGIFKSAFEHAAHAMAISDAEGRVIFANERYLRYFDISKEKVKGSRITAVLPPHMQNRAEILYERQFKRGTKPASFEYEITTEENEVLILESYIDFINDDGKRVGLLTEIRDITKTKKLQQELDLNLRRYRKAQRLGGVGNWEYDLQSGRFWASREARRIYGLQGKDSYLSTEEVESYIQDRESVHQALIELVEHNKEFDEQIEIIKKDTGEHRTIRSRAILERDRNGNPVLVSGVIRDITETKETKEKLKESEKKYRNLFEHIQDVFYEVDMNGVLLEVSPSVKELSGGHVLREDLIGRPLASLYSDPGERDRVLEELHQKGRVTDREVTLKNLDGSKPVASISAQLQTDSHGNPVSIIGTVRDITARKRAEEAMRESERMAKAIADTSPVLLFISDLEKERNIWSNKEHKEFFKDELDDPASIGYAEVQRLIHPDDRERFVDQIKEMVLNPEVEHLDTEVRLKHQGQWKWMNSRFNIFRYNDKGMPVQILGTLFDINDRKRAVERIDRAERRLRSLIENAPDGLVILDAVGKYVYASPNSLRHFGYTETDIVGKHGDKYTHPDDLPKIQKVFEHVMHHPGEKPKASYRFRNKQGEYRWIETTFTNLLHDEAVQGIVLNFTDITEKKYAEKELVKAKEKAEESESRYRKAQEVGHIGSWEICLETGKFWGSQEGKRLYNLDMNREWFDPDEVMEKVIPGDRDRVNNALADLLNKDIAYDIQFAVQPDDNSQTMVIRSIAEIVQDNSGKPVKVAGVLQDISKQKRVEAELIAAKDKAEEADRLKSAFLANMSHEIRTPMNGIIGFADLLKEPNLSGEEQREYVDIILKSGDRMLNTINDLIDISKIEAGQVKIKRSKFDVISMMEYNYAFFNPEAEKKGLDFRFAKCELAALYLETDEEKLQSILSNLLKNAVKYTKEGEIEFGCRKKESELEFFVRDTGIGIPEDRRSAVFDRFVQADIEDTRAYEGSGLGLSIAMAYVQMLDGRMWFHSEEGKGSTFYFTLPLVDTTGMKEKTADKKNISIASGGNGKYDTVLIVDDEEVSRFYLAELLKNKFSKIIMAANGREAVRLYREHGNINLILMDIKMPVMDGYKATREIRNMNDKVVIIAQTAYALEGDREKSLEAGCNDYLSKPVNRKMLMDKISINLKGS